MKKILVAILILTLCGCSSIQYMQPGSDKLPMVADESKGILIIQSTFGVRQFPVLFLAKKASEPLDYSSLTKVDVVEFANYEGAIIPTYAPKDPYGIHAFSLDPGKYFIMRCIFGMPEKEWCIPGVSTFKGEVVGLPFFEVKSGEVVNVGNLNISGDREYQVIDNTDEVIEYIEANHKKLNESVKYKPIQFGPW